MTMELGEDHGRKPLAVMLLGEYRTSKDRSLRLIVAKLFSANHWVQVRKLRLVYVIPLLSSSFTNFNSSLEGDLRNIPFCDIPIP
jgi:hypothetical protein